MAELKQGSDPHMGQLFELEEKHLRLRVKQLVGGSLNGMRIRQSAADRDACPLEGSEAGSWSLGIVEKSQGNGCC